MKLAFQEEINNAAQKIETLFHTHITEPLGLPKDRVRGIAGKNDGNILNRAFAIDDITKMVNPNQPLNLLFGTAKAELGGNNGINFDPKYMHVQSCPKENPHHHRPARITKVNDKIIITEAPYSKESFFQTVNEVNGGNTKFILSITTPNDDITRGGAS